MQRGADSVRDVGFDELKDGLRDGSITLVDVRESYEFAAGTIPGAVSMPLSSFDPAGLPPDRRIVFSCAAGVRSLQAVDLGRAAGVNVGEHFAPGFKGWAASGEPVEVPDAH